VKPAKATGIAVIRSITIAPWEYPPSTIRVLGQFAATDATWALAWTAPVEAEPVKSSLAG
jgi:hypothetical protein